MVAGGAQGFEMVKAVRCRVYGIAALPAVPLAGAMRLYFILVVTSLNS